MNYLFVEIEFTSYRAKHDKISYYSNEVFINYNFMKGPIGYYPIKRIF